MSVFFRLMFLMGLSAGFLFAQPPAGELPMLKGPYLGQKAPGKSPELFAPGIVSTGAHEHSSPVFTPDGQEVYWTVNVMFEGVYVTHLILGARLQDGVWTRPEIPAVCRRFAFCENPCLSPDGQRLYFNASASFDSQHNVPTELYTADRTPVGWGEARPVRFSGGAFPLGPSLSAKGNLFFTHSDPSNLARSGLAFATPVGEGFSAPVLLDERLRAGRSTYTPLVAPDESWLIFASWREEGLGKCDLYISFKDESGRWGDPRPLPPGINSEANERFPVLSPDGKYLFFLSSRTIPGAGPHDPGNGSGDVYWMSAAIIEELRKEALKK